MRLTISALMFTAVVMTTAGCSTARRAAAIPQRGAADIFSADSQYDSDPPSPGNSGRMAIQPNPVPPAQGVSHVRGISFLQILGHGQPECGEASCTPEPACQAPADPCISDDACAEEGCCQKKRSCLLKGWDHLRSKFHKDDCAESTCCVPEAVCTPEPICTAEECGESGHRSCLSHLSGLWKRHHRPQCGEDSCTEQVICAPEGCCQTDGCQRQGLLSCMKDFLHFNPFCHNRSSCGEYCEAGCGSERCDENAENSADCEHCRPESPLADPMQDPFIGNDVPEPAQQNPGSVPQVPMGIDVTPGESQPADTQPTEVVPEPAATQQQAIPLLPVPGSFTDQAAVNPEIWPRLKVEEPVIKPSGRPERVARQDWTFNTHPTGWKK